MVLKSNQEIDEFLGFKIKEIEHYLLLKAKTGRPEGNHHTWGHYLHQGQQTWVGLDPQTLQTPYCEIEEALKVLRPGVGVKLVDLGAGYGRVGVVLNKFYPEAEFLGLEYVPERVAEGQRVFKLLGMNPDHLQVQDLTALDFILPLADIYFLYDYGNVNGIRKTLKQMEKIADQKRFSVIARGKGARSLIEYEFLWLSAVYQAENFSIYSM